MRGLQPFFYAGEVFDDNIGIIAPKDDSALAAIWCFIESGDYLTAIRRIDQKLNVTAATLTKVPFDLAHWQKVAAEKYPNRIAEAVFERPDAMVVQRASARFRPSVAGGRGAPGRLPVAAPDGIEFPRIAQR